MLPLAVFEGPDESSEQVSCSGEWRRRVMGGAREIRERRRRRQAADFDGRRGDAYAVVARHVSAPATDDGGPENGGETETSVDSRVLGTAEKMKKTKLMPSLKRNWDWGVE